MFPTPKPKSKLQKQIDYLILKLQDYDPTSEEYGTIMERLAKLHKIEQEAKPDRISQDTLAMVVGNLLGIVMIIRHEELNVIATRALGFVMKPR